MSKADRHVISNLKGGWSVVTSGSARATRNFDKQSDAVKYAKDSAKKAGSGVYVHRRDGTISERDCYPEKG